MVTAFLEVHDDVQQRHLVSSSFGVQSLEVFRQDELVVFPVNRRRHVFTPFKLHHFQPRPPSPAPPLTSAWG